MQQDNSRKILLCSPSNIMNCGISRWTNHILSYYNKTTKSILLQHYYPKLKGVYNDTPFLKRVLIGLNGYIPFLLGLQKILKTQKYDILHFISSGSLALLRDLITIEIARKRRVKTIIHFRFGRIPEIYKSKNWEYRLIHKVITRVDHAIVIDESSYQVLIDEKYDNISLLPNPLSEKIQEIINTNSEIVRQSNKIVFVGHLVETKGVNELITACKSIKDIKLKMIGYVTDSVKIELLKLAGDNSSDWLEITGELDYEIAVKEMLSASVFVLPTYTEGFPNVILESMACGCAIVTTPVGAIPEMLDIKSDTKFGLCVPPKNVEKLSEAISKMLDDRDFAIQCGKNAKMRVNQLYSMSTIWKNLEVLWEKQ